MAVLVYGQGALSEFPSDAKSVSADYFKRLGTDNVVVGKINAVGSDRYQVNFQLLNIFDCKGAGSVVLSKNFTVSGNELRTLSHHISDLIYQQITGVRGIFSTKIAYVVVQRSQDGQARYTLEVSDQDGYNPRAMLNSPDRLCRLPGQ